MRIDFVIHSKKGTEHISMTWEQSWLPRQGDKMDLPSYPELSVYYVHWKDRAGVLYPEVHLLRFSED